MTGAAKRWVALWLWACIVGTPAAAASLAAADPEADPVGDAPVVPARINDPYQDPDFDQWSRTFESPGREVFDERFRIVAALGLQPGMAVADVGAGTGLFSLLFARAVGENGRVYAVDVSQTFIDGIVERSGDYHVGNVVGVLGAQRSTGLAPGSVDLVFVCDTYHHFEYPRVMLASIAQALRPGGQLVVIDYRRLPGVSRPWVLGHVRAGEGEVVEEIEAMGFARVRAEEFLRDNWFLRFRKLVPDDLPEPAADASAHRPTASSGDE